MKILPHNLRLSLDAEPLDFVEVKIAKYGTQRSINIYINYDLVFQLINVKEGSLEIYQVEPSGEPDAGRKELKPV